MGVLTGAAGSVMGNRRSRVAWHTATGAIVAAYMLAAVVAAAHQVVSAPEWLALHLLVLGTATNAVFVWSRFFAQALLHASRAPSGRRGCGWEC